MPIYIDEQGNFRNVPQGKEDLFMKRFPGGRAASEQDILKYEDEKTKKNAPVRQEASDKEKDYYLPPMIPPVSEMPKAEGLSPFKTKTFKESINDVVANDDLRNMDQLTSAAIDEYDSYKKWIDDVNRDESLSPGAKERLNNIYRENFNYTDNPVNEVRIPSVARGYLQNIEKQNPLYPREWPYYNKNQEAYSKREEGKRLVSDFLVNSPKGRAIMEWEENILKQLDADIDKLSADIAEYEKNGKKVVKTIYQPGSPMFGGGKYETFSVPERFKDVSVAKSQLLQLQGLRDAVNDGDKGALMQFSNELGRRSGEAAMDVGTLGVSKLLLNRELYSALQNPENTFTQEANDLLNSYRNYHHADRTIAQDIANGVTDNVGYIAQFAATGGIASVLTKGTATAIATKLGGNLTARALGTLGEDVAVAVVRTTFMPNTLATAYQKNIENPGSFLDAYTAAFYQNLIENFSEGLGDHMTGKLWKRNKILSKLSKHTGMQGFAPEFIEEQAATILHSAAGDGQGQWSDLIDPRNQLVTAGTLAIMQIPHASIAAGGYAAGKANNIMQKRSIRKGYETNVRNMRAMFQDKGEEFMSEISNIIDQDNGTGANAAIVLNEVMGDKELTISERETIVKYTLAYSAWSSLNKAKQETVTTAAAEAAATVSENINPQMNAVVGAVIVGSKTPMVVVGGNIVLMEDGRVDKENSDKEIYYIDNDGKKQVISIQFVESVSEIIPAEEAQQQAADIASSPIIAQQENDEIRDYEEGEKVRFSQDGGQTSLIGRVAGMDESGRYIMQVETPAGMTNVAVEPRHIINEDNLRGVDHGLMVNYRNEKGELKQGEVQNMYALRHQGVIIVGEEEVPIDSIIGLADQEIKTGDNVVPELEESGNESGGINAEQEEQSNTIAAEEWEKQNFSEEEITKRREYGLHPIDEYETTYRGTSKAEWEAIQGGETMSSEGLSDGNTYVTPSKKLAESSGKGVGAECVIEFKPEAKVKMKKGDSKFDSVEYYAHDLTIHDVARVYDTSGNVIYESESGTGSQETTQSSAFEQIPTDQKGQILFEQAPVETTIGALREVYENEGEMLTVVDATIGGVQKQMEKLKTPKPTGDITKDIANKRAAKQTLSELGQKLDYWRSVRSMVAKKPEAEKRIESKVKQKNGVRPLTAYQKRLNAIKDNVQSIRDRILYGIAAGDYKFRWNDKGTSVGLARELGLTASEKERRARFGILSKDGYTPSTLAHHIWEDMGTELDDNDIRSEVIDILQTVTSKSQALKALEESLLLSEEEYYQEQAAMWEQEQELREELDVEYNEIMDEYIKKEFVYLDDKALAEGATKEQTDNAITPFDYLDLIEYLQYGRQGQEQTSDRRSNNDQNPISISEGETTEGTQQMVGERNRPDEDNGYSDTDAGIIGLRHEGRAEIREKSNTGGSRERGEENNSPRDYGQGTTEREIGERNRSGNDKENQSVSPVSGRTISDTGYGRERGSNVSGRTNSEEENRLALSPEHARVAKETTDRIDGEIAKAKAELSAKQKELSSAKKRLGKAQSETQGNLFEERQTEGLFDVPADIGRGNIGAILDPIRNEITALEEHIAQLERGRENTVRQALDDFESQITIFDEIARAEAETNTHPTEAQKEAGNYKKGKVTIQGFDISIEQPKGSTRSVKDANGKEWSVTMNNTYGYIRGTEGKDGDHIDVFLGNNPESNHVFVVDQIDPGTGQFDEHKVMLGFDTIDEAKAAYLSNYEEDWQGLGNLTQVDVETFGKWANSDTRRIKPFAEYREIQEGNVNDRKIGRAQSTTDKFKPISKNKFDKLIARLKATGLAMRVIADEAEFTTKLNELINDDTVAKQMLSEMDSIKQKAITDGTFMKAPNGKPSNLNENQWLQVRTKAFKEWFGDWEKAVRIEKLRASKSVEITGEEITPSDDLKQYRKNANEYGLRLRDTYTNNDIGTKITLGKNGIKEVTSHDLSKEQLQSVAAIPQIIENGIYIDTRPNNDKAKHPTVESYDYYVVGINIGGEDYTVRSIIAIDKDGERYYDHKLTHIEKIKLINLLNQSVYDDLASSELSSTVASGVMSNEKSGEQGRGNRTSTPISINKDRVLVSILQNNSSKVTDENGEPKIVAHSTNAKFTEFKNRQENDSGWLGAGYYFFGDRSLDGQYGQNVMDVFLNIREPYYATNEDINELSARNDVDISKQFTEDLESEGYDGVSYNGNLNDEYVVFSPTQIKSAISNAGAFDSSNPDIRMQILGETGASNLDNVDSNSKRIPDLIIAKEMEQAGKDGKTIKFATGWERGTEGKWRYEIPDSKMTQKFKDLDIGGSILLEEALADKALFDAYPQLKEVKIEIEDTREFNGTWDKSTKTIRLSAHIPEYRNGRSQSDESINREAINKDFRSVLLHEIQHAIQDIEGFARGGNTRMFSSPTNLEKKYILFNSSVNLLEGDLYLNIGKLLNDDRFSGWRKEFSEEGHSQLLNGIRNMYNSMDEKLFMSNYNYILNEGNKPSATEQYRRLAGEVEARNVQRRMDMTEHERRAFVLENTEDTPRKDQHIISNPDIRMQALWHGSPHSFKKFSTAYIGTGEGAQAFGWGLYFTELKDIAEWYAKNLKSEKHKENAIINKIAQDILESNNGNREEALQYERSLLDEDWSDKKRVRRVIKVLETGKPLNEGKSHLYEVSVGDLNFMRWDESLSETQIEQIKEQAKKENLTDRWGRSINDKGYYPNSIPFPKGSKGESVYKQIEHEFNLSPQKVSTLLLNAGINGVQYPAEGSSKRETRGFNYVVFDEASVEINNRIRLLSTPTGNIYGFVTEDNIVYLNPRMMNANTPIHEFGHLWNSFIQETNPKLWEKGNALVMASEYWAKVNNNPAYSSLTEDRKVDEAMAMAIGDKGEAVMQSRNIVSIAGIKTWLREVWDWIKQRFGISEQLDIESMSLSDFTDKAASDLLGGKKLTDTNAETEHRQQVIEATRVINNQFNSELTQQIEGTLSKGHTYRLGMPSSILQSAGIPNLEIELRASRLQDKSMQENHPFELAEVMNLPEAVQKPLAVFRSATHLGSFVIMTELEHKGKNYVVAIQTNKIKGRLEINDIRSIHYRNSNAHMANWIDEGLLEYADKKRMTEWLSKQRYNSAEVRQLFSHAANIVKNFENPIQNDNFVKNQNDDGREQAKETGARYQSIDDDEGNVKEAMAEARRKELDRKLNNLRHKIREAWEDRHLAVKEFLDVLRNNGTKIDEHNDYYLQATHINGKNDAQLEYYHNEYQKPLNEAISDLMKKGYEYRDVENYAILKHGLERNEWMRNDAINEYMTEHPEASQEDIDKFTEKLPDDYSGVIEVQKEVETSAEMYIKDFEDKAEANLTDNFWKRVNDATHYALQKQYEGGLISRILLDDLTARYKYYIPLRGHDAETAEDRWDYSPDTGTYFVNPVMKANGRRSRSEKPFAYIAQAAQSAINSANTNTLNQTILRLARKDKTGLLTATNTWYLKLGVGTDGKPAYEAQEPAYSENADQYQQNIAAFEEIMRGLAKQGFAFQKRGKLNVGRMFIKPRQKKQHAIQVYQNGESYNVYVNANPAVSRAVNGMNSKDLHKDLKFIAKVSRQMAANFTTRNPQFVLSNFSRDYLFASSILPVKEDAKYAIAFQQNIPNAAAALQRNIRGKSNMSSVYDRYAAEFVLNGGKTGFSHLLELQQVQKRIERETEKRGKKNAVRHMLDAISSCNEFVENLSRFSVYITSREQGRSIIRSISDAKEVTVNFNRSGAGGYGSQYVRPLYLFVNAGIQALSNFAKVADKNKGKTAVLVSSYALSGFIMPILSMMVGGDDGYDEYLKLSDWERQNNLCVYTGNGFMKIPLPHELRVFHKMGDNVHQSVFGGKDVSDTVIDTALGFADLVPANPTGAINASWAELIPDAMRPLAQLAANKDFTGRRITKENVSSHVPGYLRVRTNKKGDVYAPSFLVKMAKWTDNATGGDGVEKGVVSFNPDVSNHLMKGYFGGLYTILMQGIQIADKTYDFADTGELKIKSGDIPIARAFYISSDDLQTTNNGLNTKYYRIKDEIKEKRRKAKGYEEQAKNGKIGIEELASKTQQLNDGVTMEIYNRIKIIEKFEGKLKETDGEDQKTLERIITDMKQEVVELNN